MQSREPREIVFALKVDLDSADYLLQASFTPVVCPGGIVKLHRVAIVAGATLIAAACSGGEPAAAPQTTAVVVETTTSTTAAPTTVAPTIAPTTAAPTTATPTDGTPESLAFASTADIGRLFEVDGTAQLFDGPGGDVTGTLEDGRLVRAGAARNSDGSLFVGILDPNDPSAALGWVEALSLRPTNQASFSTDESLRNQLRQAIVTTGQDTVEVVSQPGAGVAVATLSNREAALHSGNRALSSDGAIWLEVVDPDTATPIGWVPANNFVEIRANSARNSAFLDTDRSPDSGVSYGASLPVVTVATAGCNAVQIELQNPSTTTGLALVFAAETPFAIVGSSVETWQGNQLFVDPGDSTTLTLLNNDATTWHFAALDNDGRAEAARGPSGDLIGTDGTAARATNVQQVSASAGSCVFVPPPVDEYDGFTGLDEPVELDVDALADGEIVALEDGSTVEGSAGEPGEESGEPVDESAVDQAASTDGTTITDPNPPVATTAAPADAATTDPAAEG